MTSCPQQGKAKNVSKQLMKNETQKEYCLTIEQIKEVIINDRKKLLKHIGDEMAYGMDDHLDYPINMPTFDS